jgi:hypothetical protein
MIPYNKKNKGRLPNLINTSNDKHITNHMQ